MSDFAPADFLARGLGLGPLSEPPVAVPVGTCCAITGQSLIAGYPVADMVTDTTNEFLDCFRGGVGGWVSENAARCFKNASPRDGNPTARAVMVFEDGTYFNPLISLASAVAQGRPCWSRLVREVWQTHCAQRVLIILTTDMKRRLWIRARIGALGPQTPVLYYDSETAGNEVLLINWPRLLECLDLVEEVYVAGFPKAAIRESLYSTTRAIEQVGWVGMRQYERAVAPWRGTPEFQVACLIAQKPLGEEKVEEKNYESDCVTQIRML